jgi:hypothetical protein
MLEIMFFIVVLWFLNGYHKATINLNVRRDDF